MMTLNYLTTHAQVHYAIHLIEQAVLYIVQRVVTELLVVGEDSYGHFTGQIKTI